MDWSAWSQESLLLMSSRTRELLVQHQIKADCDYHWDLDAAVLSLGETAFRLVTIGTVAADSFLWAWANEAIPSCAKVGVEKVRQFGLEHGLGLLAAPRSEGGLAQGKECLAVAGRILDGQGVSMNRTDDGFILFVLFKSTRN